MLFSIQNFPFFVGLTNVSGTLIYMTKKQIKRHVLNLNFKLDREYKNCPKKKIQDICWKYIKKI